MSIQIRFDHHPPPSGSYWLEIIDPGYDLLSMALNDGMLNNDGGRELSEILELARSIQRGEQSPTLYIPELYAIDMYPDRVEFHVPDWGRGGPPRPIPDEEKLIITMNDFIDVVERWATFLREHSK